jgi:hypothetical protein
MRKQLRNLGYRNAPSFDMRSTVREYADVSAGIRIAQQKMHQELLDGKTSQDDINRELAEMIPADEFNSLSHYERLLEFAKLRYLLGVRTRLDNLHSRANPEPAKPPDDKTETKIEPTAVPAVSVATRAGRGRPKKVKTNEEKMANLMSYSATGNGGYLYRFIIKSSRTGGRKYIYTNSQKAGARVLYGLRAVNKDGGMPKKKLDGTQESKAEWDRTYAGQMRSLGASDAKMKYTSPHGRITVEKISGEEVDLDRVKYAIQDSQDFRYFTSSRRIIAHIVPARELINISGVSNANISRADAEQKSADPANDEVSIIDKTDLTAESDYPDDAKRQITHRSTQLKWDPNYQTMSQDTLDTVSEYTYGKNINADIIAESLLNGELDESQLKRSSI